MKRSLYWIMVLTLLGVGPLGVKAQIVVPDLSPFATVTQRIGFHDVKIEYSRPSVRGRIIFGELVPYGKIWRVGANASTKITFWEPVTIQDQHTLPMGTYALYAIPHEDEWTIILNKNTSLWGAYNYSERDDALRFTVKPVRLKDQVETFTIDIANVCSNCGEIQLRWDYTMVAFNIGTNVDDEVMAQIKGFTSNPEGKLAGQYYLAAKYYLDTGRDLNQALVWIDKSLAITPEAYWILHTKAEIQAKMGDYNAAIKTANLSIEQAKAANADEYVTMNEREIEKWKKVRRSGS